jgi:hypothetical protein
MAGWGFVGPGEKELQVIEVVNLSGGLRILAPQPLAETLDFGYHCYTSWWYDMD